MKNNLIAILASACVLLTLALCLVGVRNAVSYSERQSFNAQISDLQAQLKSLEAMTNSLMLSNDMISSTYEAEIAGLQNKLTNPIVEMNQSSSSDLTPAEQENIEKSTYINNSLVLYNYRAGRWFNYLEDLVPGVNFKIKNIGEKTLTEVEVTVWFYDADGNTIHEEKYLPVTEDQPLRPGYIWQQDAGYFYEVKNVPSEWNGATAVKITDIKFAD